MGFHPIVILSMQAISLIYQFWIHTETIRKMPYLLELVLNTPSHHRVHHGSDIKYLDRNHAGILIIWDRMFGPPGWSHDGSRQTTAELRVAANLRSQISDLG